MHAILCQAYARLCDNVHMPTFLLPYTGVMTPFCAQIIPLLSIVLSK